MTLIRSAAASILLLIAAQGWVHAQLRQPRCGGWPSGEGNPGLVIGGVGSTCYGQLFARFSSKLQLVGVRVVRPPAHGTFQLIGLREFEFRPASNLSGFDEFVIEITWNRAGVEEIRRQRYRATTDAEYARAGGSAGNAPPGMTVTRRPGIGRRVER